mmetsp:Transcript_146463/g.255443  ORF Transcript_146463/g.255443 Transcript_146463/m.255443 type:complete len:273 (-) Transcript_146463:373-1191(-)
MALLSLERLASGTHIGTNHMRSALVTAKDSPPWKGHKHPSYNKPCQPWTPHTRTLKAPSPTQAPSRSPKAPVGAEAPVTHRSLEFEEESLAEVTVASPDTQFELATYTRKALLSPWSSHGGCHRPYLSLMAWMLHTVPSRSCLLGPVAQLHTWRPQACSLQRPSEASSHCRRAPTAGTPTEWAEQAVQRATESWPPPPCRRCSLYPWRPRRSAASRELTSHPALPAARPPERSRCLHLVALRRKHPSRSPLELQPSAGPHSSMMPSSLSSAA